MFELTGRVALVTGGSSGVGFAMAQALAGAGAAVVLVARREEALRAGVQRISSEGGKAAHVACDVSDRSRLGDCVAQVAAHFGAPDILVNAAGINLREPVDRITEASWDAQILLNLTVPFFLARHLVPAMIAKGWGRIINVASMQSVRAFPDGAPYGA